MVDSVAGPRDANGVVWTLDEGADLNANKVQLAAGRAIGEHVNGEVDVLVYVLDGEGDLFVSGDRHRLQAGTLALVPKGSSRAVHARGSGLAYLSIHRRRGPLSIGRRSAVDGGTAENEHSA